MNTIVNTAQVESLLKLFKEFDSSYEFDKLYNSANAEYSDFIIKLKFFFATENTEEAEAKIHLLKNKFKNLGMDESASILTEMRGYVAGTMRSSKAEEGLALRLKESVSTSFNYIFENYMG